MSNVRGYRGISFPFRIGVKGGIQMSSTSPEDASHLVESIQQILSTRKYERSMEFHIFSDLDTDIFEPTDTSTQTLIQNQVVEALSKLEPRIKVLSVDTDVEGNTIFATINFKVPLYNTEYTTRIKVGELSAENPN